MTGQSSTRHAQIDELRKKLIDAAKEANELRTEIMRFRGTKDENHRLNRPQEGMQLGVQIGVCMNCIVMQQALTMANAALKCKCQMGKSSTAAVFEDISNSKTNSNFI